MHVRWELVEVFFALFSFEDYESKEKEKLSSEIKKWFIKMSACGVVVLCL